MKKKNGGFSLVELVVVIAIMSLLVSAVIIGAGFLYGLEARDCAEKIVGYLDDAKSASMTYDNAKIKLYYDAGDYKLDIGDYSYEVVKVGSYFEKTDSLIEKSVTTHVIGDDSITVMCKFLGDSDYTDVKIFPVMLGFDRSSGAFTGATIYDASGAVINTDKAITEILISQDSKSYTIHCVKTTGKYYME